MSLEKYIGCIIRIVYIDRNNRITERRIKIKSIGDGRIRAHCLTSDALRVFVINNVLSYELVRKHAS